MINKVGVIAGLLCGQVLAQRYKVIRDKWDWKNAKTLCEAMNANLAAEIPKELREPGEDYWLDTECTYFKDGKISFDENCLEERKFICDRGVQPVEEVGKVTVIDSNLEMTVKERLNRIMQNKAAKALLAINAAGDAREEHDKAKSQKTGGTLTAKNEDMLDAIDKVVVTAGAQVILERTKKLIP